MLTISQEDLGRTDEPLLGEIKAKLEARLEEGRGGKVNQPNMDNFQAMAYAGLAMKNKGFSDEQIKKVLMEMWVLFDEITESEAEERWKNQR